ncbi:adenosine kinase [Parasphingorhabdus halotolerans]|uniref:Adenosine kinase n=1 Tax=Parasphingorhabdus halotolerans TaxID=2725558 RepID=A0A6H2DRD8_9SPHN|nr:adenosine kinase [Parasphingorhabdus halotolerans]QJB70236.1 adenosine kinase [Parasphingorhabdus halotolerans]
MTTEARYDIVAIGNAIVDVIAQADDAFLEEEQLTKGSMALIDAARATELYNDMGPAREISGGSGANTLAGASTLGRQCALIAQVADDQLGEVFAHDIRATGIDFDVAPLGKEPPTARCLIFVTPDAQRTMNTFLGASQFLPASAVDAELIASGAILYLEGYLWDAEEPKAAMALGIDIARQNGRKVAFTLSDGFCVDRHRDEFVGLIKDGKIDILFSNEDEIKSLCETDDFDAAVAQTAKQVETLVVTRSEKGAIALQNGTTHSVAAEPVAKIVDTTGAGDLFAAGFLSGYIEQRSMEDCLTIGAVAAAEVISHYGARPEADLKALVTAHLG